jgi:hypothetical protein
MPTLDVDQSEGKRLIYALRPWRRLLPMTARPSLRSCSMQRSERSAANVARLRYVTFRLGGILGLDLCRGFLIVTATGRYSPTEKVRSIPGGL